MSITTNNLSIGYGKAVIQRELNLMIHEGEMVAMLGRNGCGKSTLLRTLAGLQPALGGSFSLGTEEQNKQQLPALVLTEHEAIGMSTVHDIVAMGRYAYTNFLGGLSAHDEQIISEALKAVGDVPADRRFDSLSDGEKARVLIAKALAQETSVILLDEPTAHLDLPNRILTLRLLKKLAHEKSKTILISTHELELALAESDRILLMMPKGGGLRLDTAEQLKKDGAFEEAFGMKVEGYFAK